jgi:hypothetical protein
MNDTAGIVGSGSVVRRYWREAAGALVVLLAQLATLPLTPWENDEFLFAAAVKKFEPTIWVYHPHPPGFPLYVLLGKALNELLHDPWRALVLLGALSAPAGFVALSRAFLRWLGDADLAACASLLFYFSASALLHQPLALSDGVSMTFVALALYCMAVEHEPAHDRAAIGLGLWTSAAIGCRPQLLVALLPAFAVALVRLPSNRKRLAALIAFTLVSLMWFLPLLDAAGGPHELLIYEQQQAKYFATHDAAMSRGAKSVPEIVTRFLLHPWGSKYLTLPLLVAVALGALPAARRWRPMLPFLVFTLIWLAFELGWMDPADAARYSLPSMLLTAAVAALGFGVLRASTHVQWAPWIATALFAAGAWIYVRPITATRHVQASPPAAAAAYVQQHLVPNTVVLWDPSLRPAAEYLLPQFRSTVIEKGLRDAYNRADVPLVLYVDGGSHFPDAHVFSWPESDAYGKLTRNHYRSVTLDPVDPEERYLPLQGIYPAERTVQGDEWHWLTGDASLRLPAQLGHSVELRFRLSHDAPYASNDVRIFVDGRQSAAATVKKDDTAVALVPLPGGAGEPVVRIVSAQSFRPADVLHNQDPRTLATQLVYVRQR